MAAYGVEPGPGLKRLPCCAKGLGQWPRGDGLASSLSKTKIWWLAPFRKPFLAAAVRS